MPPPQTTARDLLWVAVGDIHEDTALFSRIPELAEAGGIIVTGDLTNFGGIAEAEAVLNSLRACGVPVFAQIGNMDKPEVDAWLSGQGINLHTHVRELTPEILMFGVGGSTITPFNTPSEFPESAYTTWLDACRQRARAYRHTVLVSHNPPKDTACDALPNGAHVGSTAVREFIEKTQPDICLCGHIHEGRSEDRIGRTVIVNPGPLVMGGYVAVCMRAGELSARLCVMKA